VGDIKPDSEINQNTKEQAGAEVCAQSHKLVQKYQYRQKYRLGEYFSIGIGWTHIAPTPLALL
jgi:hypothetical protein